MTRLRFVVRTNPTKGEAGDLARYGNVTFAPMDALADGLGGIDTSIDMPATELATGNYSYFAEGDILLAKVTPCFENGKKAFVANLPNRIGFATSEVHVIRPDKLCVDAGYIGYLLSSEAFKAAGIASMTGAGGLRRVSENCIKDFLLPITDVEKQRNIAAFLDHETHYIERLILKKERLAQVLEDSRVATISRAVSVGFDPSAEMAVTGSPYIPRVPRNWHVLQLKHLAQVRGGLTLGRTLNAGEATVPVPYLRVANVQAGWLDLSDVAEIDATSNEVSRSSLRFGDVLMNEGGDNDKLGRGAVWHQPFSPCLHQNHVFCVRPHDTRYSQWISLASNARYARDFFYLHSNQSTNLASISKTNLQRFPIAVPPIDELSALLERIGKRLDLLKKAASKTKLSIERLRERRAAIISAAVIGQIDCKSPALKTANKCQDEFV